MKLQYLILFILIAACNSQAEYTNDEVLSIGHELNSQFYTGKLASLHPKIYDKSFTLQNLKDFKKKVDSELGYELELIDEIIDNKIWKNEQYYGYVRYSSFSKTNRPVRTIFAFTKDEIIYRFEVSQVPDPVHSNREKYTSKTELRLPFEGEWYVASGGRSSMYNHHSVLQSTRFASDFIIKKDESYYKSSGRNGV